MADELTLLWQPNQERLAKAKITAYMASLAQGGRHFSNYDKSFIILNSFSKGIILIV